MKIKDMSLTDDWKAGKLKAGPYYVKLSNGRVDVAKLSKFNRFYAICYTFEVVEVIAPCSYDHFVELTEKVKGLENKQLRQLLKECKEYLSDVDTYFTKIEEQQAEIDRLRETIRLARDTAYQSTQDCHRCGFIDDLLTKTLNEESEERAK